MINDSIFSTVLINGGDTAPGSSLLQRELYIDKHGNLYYGKAIENEDGTITPNGTPSKVNAYKADVINCSKLFNFDSTGNGAASLGPLTVTAEGLVGTGEEDSKPTISDTTISNFIYNNGKLQDVKISGNSEFTGTRVKTSKLVASSDMLYGYTLPETPEEGQVFFLIVQ